MLAGRYFNYFSSPKDTRISLALIVSQCQEPLSSAQYLNSIVKTLNKAYTTSITFVCKCGMRYHCTYSVANVGRETHTFVKYIVDTYGELRDITVFINGGFAAKVHTVVALKHITRTLKGGHFHSRQARGLYIDRDVRSIDFARKRLSSLSQTTCAGIISKYCTASTPLEALRSKRGKPRCSQTFPCVSGQECPCDIQLNCSWRGSSAQNWGQVMTLDPTVSRKGIQGESFYGWACSRMSLTPHILRTCGASWGSVFAVGADRVKLLPLGFYENLLREYEIYSTNGGIMGHYMERIFRALFYCSQN